MTTYISLLRGINVSGKNLIKMEFLRKLYERLGFQDIKSYLQSGNIIFKEKNSSPLSLAQGLSKEIEKEFGSHVEVVVLTLDQLKSVVDHLPFQNDPSKDPAFIHVTFLFSKPDYFDLATIENKKQNQEEIVISRDIVYLYCPMGYGRTKLTTTFLEAKLRVTATTRNWKTTNELLKIAQTTSGL